MKMDEVIKAIETAKNDFASRASKLVNGLSTYGMVKVSYACAGLDFRINAKLTDCNGHVHDVELFACYRDYKDASNMALGVAYKLDGDEWESRYSDDDTWHGLAMAVLDLKNDLA